MSGSKFPFFTTKLQTFTRFTFGKRLQSAVTRENLFFASFLELYSGICVQILRFPNKFLHFALYSLVRRVQRVSAFVTGKRERALERDLDPDILYVESKQAARQVLLKML